MIIHKKLLIILILILNITIINTAETANKKKHRSFNDYYHNIQNKLSNKNYTGAIQDLINIQNFYPIEPYSQQIQLNLIYAYYKSGDLNSANSSIQMFFHKYPNHKYLDYILYIHGLINMSLDKKTIPFFLTKYFNIYRYNYNPHYAIDAFHSFSKLIQRYPNSQYYIDSYKRLIILKNRIAEYELSIIKFYYQRCAYISVINRSEKMLRYFSDTQATRQTLYYMKHAYQCINLTDQANIINKIITENSITY